MWWCVQDFAGWGCGPVSVWAQGLNISVLSWIEQEAKYIVFAYYCQHQHKLSHMEVKIGLYCSILYAIFRPYECERLFCQRT
jgi:hypothetical protein